MTKDERAAIEQVIKAIQVDPDDEVTRLVNGDWCEENGFNEAAKMLREGNWHGAVFALRLKVPDLPRNQMNPSILFTDLYPDGFWERNDWFDNHKNLSMTCRCEVRLAQPYFANDPIPAPAFQQVFLTCYDFRAYPRYGKGMLYTTICVGQCSRCRRVFWGCKDDDLITIIRMCEIAKESSDEIDRRPTQYPWPG